MLPALTSIQRLKAVTNVDRRGFFRELSGGTLPQRPPWAVPDSAFAKLCDGCGACIRRCPEAIIVAGRGGLPRIDFALGGCRLCGRCVEACETGALAGGPPAAAWSLTALISANCLEQKGISCRVCEGACDAAALRFRPLPGGRAQVIVAADRCTGCGACVSACPAGAITMAAPDRQPQQEETAA